MEMKTESNSSEQCLPEGEFRLKYGQTTYKIKVFFDHEGQTTAEDRIKRVIISEAIRKE